MYSILSAKNAFQAKSGSKRKKRFYFVIVFRFLYLSLAANTTHNRRAEEERNNNNINCNKVVSLEKSFINLRDDCQKKSRPLELLANLLFRAIERYKPSHRRNDRHSDTQCLPNR